MTVSGPLSRPSSSFFFPSAPPNKSFLLRSHHHQLATKAHTASTKSYLATALLPVIPAPPATLFLHLSVHHHHHRHHDAPPPLWLCSVLLLVSHPPIFCFLLPLRFFCDKTAKNTIRSLHRFSFQPDCSNLGTPARLATSPTLLNSFALQQSTSVDSRPLTRITTPHSICVESKLLTQPSILSNTRHSAASAPTHPLSTRSHRQQAAPFAIACRCSRLLLYGERIESRIARHPLAPLSLSHVLMITTLFTAF